MTNTFFSTMIGCIESCGNAMNQAKEKRTAFASLRVPCIFWTCC